MTLELQVLGPDLDKRKLVTEGDRELVLGRDRACDVYLPDPLRKVSRRHLAVSNVAGALHFRVLSLVNGVDLQAGEVLPGEQGVLPPGQEIRLGEYVLRFRQLPGDATWPAVVSDSAADKGPESATAPMAVSATAHAHGHFVAEPVPDTAEDDPFGDWGFETGFSSDAGHAPSQAALPQFVQGADTGDLKAFFRGMGLENDNLESLSSGELEGLGRLMRSALQGLLDLQRASAGVKRDLHAQDRTMVAVKDNNPLGGDWPDDVKLRYLAAGKSPSVAYLSPERALSALLADLLTDQLAMAVAARSSIEGVLRELSPVALKTRLLGADAKLFERARMWSAFVRHHDEKSKNPGVWAQSMLDKHFAEAFVRESDRIKRETGKRQT